MLSYYITVISWLSKKQSCIVLSSWSRNILHMLQLFKKLYGLDMNSYKVLKWYHILQFLLLLITVALAYVKDSKYSGKFKHIETRYHYIRDIVAEKKVTLKHISTSRVVTDPSIEKFILNS